MRKNNCGGCVIINGLVMGTFQNEQEKYERELAYFDTFFKSNSKAEASVEIRYNDGSVVHCIADVGSALLGLYNETIHNAMRKFWRGLMSEHDVEKSRKDLAVSFATDALDRNLPELARQFLNDYYN